MVQIGRRSCFEEKSIRAKPLTSYRPNLTARSCSRTPGRRRSQSCPWHSRKTTAFKEDNKWRLHDGNSQISATIEDKDFLYKVDHQQISFTKGDVLVCQVRVTQTQTGGGLKTEYAVIKVEEHIRSPQQMDLLIEEPKDDQTT